MQSKGELIYRKVALENDEEFDFVKSIGDTVFKAVYNEMKSPRNLVIKVKSLGQFIVRSKKINQEWANLRDNLWDYNEESNNNFITNEELEEYKKDRERYKVLKFLVEQYEVYKAKKKLYRKLRDEFIELNIQQKEIQKTS